MNTDEKLAKSDDLIDEIKKHLIRGESSDSVAVKKFHSREARARLEELKRILQGSVVCDLAGTGFILTDEPDPASDRRQYADIETPSYLRRGHPPISLKTFNR
jgi:hypothetical protein